MLGPREDNFLRVLTSLQLQCDETKPICNNCARRSTPCSFKSATQDRVAQSNSNAAIEQPPAEIPNGISTPGSFTLNTEDHGAQSSFNASTGMLSTGMSVDDSPATLAPTSHASRPITPVLTDDVRSPSFDLLDLELWHHWLFSACHSFTDSAEGLPMWRDNIPKLGVKHGYVSKLVMALSALHLAREEDASRSKALVEKCNALQATAINGMMSALTSNDTSNAGALWVAAMLLCFCSFGKGPQEGQYLVYSDDKEPEWLGLLQGVSSILTHSQNAYDGIATDLPANDTPRQQVNVEEVLEGIDKTFQDLKASINALRAEDKSFDKYKHPMEELEKCFSEVFEPCTPSPGESSARPYRIRQDQVFAWLYRLEENYLTAVQEKRPMALVILAHYLVLLAQIKDVWYIDGWTGHVMGAIRRDLHEAYLGWLEWPSRHI